MAVQQEEPVVRIGLREIYDKLCHVEAQLANEYVKKTTAWKMFGAGGTLLTIALALIAFGDRLWA